MVTTIKSIELDLPQTDLKIIRSLAKRLGWTVRIKKVSGLEKAIEDYKAGNIYEAKDVDDLMNQIFK